MKIFCLLPAVILFASCASGPTAAPAASWSPAASEGRQIRRTGSLKMKTHKLKDSSEKSIALVHSHQGILQSSTLTEDVYQATIKVPSSSLEPLMEELSSFAKVTRKSVSQDDVTRQTRDLQAEVQNKIALRNRLRELLKQATKVSDVLEIEKELANVQTELDQLTGTLKSLRSQVSSSTLSLNIERDRLPGPLGLVTKSSSWLVGKLFYLN